LRPWAAAFFPAAAIAVLACTAATHAADLPVPDLRGIWSGEGPTVLEITVQVGTALEGVLTSQGHDRPIYGVVQRDRKEIMFINPEGNRRGELVAADEMTFCLEARDDFAFDGPCVLLHREHGFTEQHGGA
jgi:hypothetical protein